MLDNAERPEAAAARGEPELWRSSRKSGDAEVFNEIINFSRRNLVFISGVIAVTLVVMSAYLAVTKPIYRGDAQILIDASLPQVLVGQLGEGRAFLDSAQVESQIAILRSEQLALAIIRQMRLANPDHQQGPSTATNSADKIDDMPPQELKRAIEGFHDGLRVRRVGPSYVIEVSYFSPEPNKAAEIANATVDAYIQDQITSRAEAARHGSLWLEGRIEELRLQMNAAALRVQEFKVKRDYRIVSKSENEPSDQYSATAKAPPHTLEELESKAQTYRKIYESFLQAYTESVQRQSYSVSNARVITRATAIKSHPKIMLLLSLAFCVGGSLGIAVALLRETFGGAKRTPAAPRSRLQRAEIY